MEKIQIKPLPHLTFDGLPIAISELTYEVRELRRLFLESEKRFLPGTDHWFNLKELCEYLPDKPTKATVYSWASNGSIPVHKSSKKLRFLKSEIDAWLMQGRKKTQIEIQVEAAAYLQSKTKGGKL